MSWLKKNLLVCAACACVVMSGAEYARHLQTRRYVRAVALEVIAKAGATDNRSKVLALRDYLRGHVSFKGVPQAGRPLLRDSPDVTLRTGRGWCGEGTRAFIDMAREVGIRAQRVELTGTEEHTVAEAELSLGERVIVDSQTPPKFKDLVSLESVVSGPLFTDYYTVNLERFHLQWLVSRFKLQNGFVPYWLENPHLIKSSAWLLVALVLVGLKLVRAALRCFLIRRGWVYSPGRGTTPGTDIRDHAGPEPATKGA